MHKTSTIHFSINNLASKSNEELFDIDSIFDYKNEFSDVNEVLNGVSYDVRQEVVNSILDIASGID